MNASSAAFLSRSVQSYQEMSWQYPLLLPCCDRPISSSPSSIGTPCDKKSVARKFRFWRPRSSRTCGSSVGPSTPLFHEQL